MIRIYLTQPYSYSIEPEAHDALDWAAEGWEKRFKELGDVNVTVSRIASSMTCESFNTGVATAKNGRYDYFAMLHSDVSAPPGWLGDLLTCLNESEADVIHAVARIKNDIGYTSTAVAYDPDPWTRKRRVTVKEAFQLPDVFTIEDIQREIDPDAKMLLFNPGCSLIRMGQWFYEWPGFNWLSKVFEPQPCVYSARSISEDYVFGHWCYDNGIKTAATRRVVTEHIGRKKYTTARPEGIDTDRDYLAAIGKPPVGEGKWVFPVEVNGWLSSAEGVAIAKLARGKRVLEVGSYCGRSTICMSQTAESIVAVDPHDGRATPDPRKTMAEMLRNLARYKCDNVTIQRCTLEEYAQGYQGEPFDMAFIDGAHDYESVKHDIGIALTMLTEDGLLAFHDYSEGHPGVKHAVDSLVRAGSLIIEQQGTVAIVKPELSHADA